ncbi:hypothetical protein P8452_62109 [Trifolium repens]|nr:hypothetical protein P8452_62109 [Trifolium repens]
MVKFMLLLRPRCFSDSLDSDMSFFLMFDYSLAEDCVVVTKMVPLPVALFKGWICVSCSSRWDFGYKVVDGDGYDGSAGSGGDEVMFAPAMVKWCWS